MAMKELFIANLDAKLIRLACLYYVRSQVNEGLQSEDFSCEGILDNTIAQVVVSKKRVRKAKNA